VNTKQPARAYSYIRFSTPEQAKGNSLQRQTDAARAWADQHKVTLDNELTFKDKGVSGFTGANRETGELGVFLECVKDGTVPPGSWLLVESLDRISRQVARKAVRTIEDIVEAGVTVVDLSDGGREYSAETLDKDGMLFMMMVVRFIRANEESTLKGVRVAKAYANKRKTFASTEKLERPYTRRLPAWIRWSNESKAYELIEERASILRRIFELTEQGWGQHRIAAWLNDSKIETWGAGGWKARYWHRSYVRKLLSNPAAIGVFVPHKMTPKVNGGPNNHRTPLDPIPHRYPPVIDKVVFERVASRLSTTEARGKNTHTPVRSIFAGVIKCRYCSGTVTRVSKGQHVYLVCSAANAKAGTCKYESVPYQGAEEALCENIGHTIELAPRGTNTAEIERDIEQRQVELDAADQAIEELLQTVITDKSMAARRALQDAEQKRDAMERALRELRDRRDALTSTNVRARLAAVESALAQSPIDVEAANKALRTAVRRMIMKPQEGTLDIYWHHAEEPQEVVFMTSRFDWDANQIEDAEQEER
jgi:DNA invertase Pin-like site-specific DNA recombinase